MNRLTAILILGLAVISMPLVAAEDGAKKPVAVKAAGNKSMDPVRGRFHQIHTRKLQLGCTNCHTSEQQDILFLRKDEALPVGMPGQVDRHMCAACHTQPGKPAWYGAAAR